MTEATRTQKRWTMIAVILGSGIVFLDSTVVNVALPRIGRELPSRLFSTLEAQSYVYHAYLLSLSALLILAGALSDYHGRRRMFTFGLAAFGATSLACALAPSMEVLILFRILQGAAGAFLVPGSLSIITSTFRGEEQGRAFGVWAGASAFTTILGPFLGGVLVDTLSWRAAFAINLPLVAVAWYGTSRHVLESRDEAATGHFDWRGAVVVFVAVGGLAYGAIRGQQQQWQDVSAFVALVLGAAASLALPVLMRRSEHPLVPPHLFRSRNFSVTNVSTLLIYGALYVTFQLMAIFVQGTLGYNAAAAGIAGLPITLLLAIFSSRFGRLAARYGPRVFMTAGPVLMALGLAWFARIPSDSDPWVFAWPSAILPPAGYLIDFLPGAIVFGIGLVVMVAPLTTALMTSVPPQNAGVASAVNNAISRVGPQLAGALIFVAIAASFYAGLGARVPDLDTSSPEVRRRIAPLNQPPPGSPDRVQQAAREASTRSFHVAMLGAAGLLLAGAAVNGVGIRNPARAPAAVGEPAAVGASERPEVREGEPAAVGERAAEGARATVGEETGQVAPPSPAVVTFDDDGEARS